MGKASSFEDVVAYLGGESWLRRTGVRAYDTDCAHVCLKLLHPNPRGVRTVTITVARDCYEIDCFGRMPAQSFDAPLLGHAQAIAPDHLSAILGELTGDENLHHHLFAARWRH